MSVKLFKPVERVALDGDNSVSFTLGDNPLYMVSASELVPGTDNSALRVTVNAEASSYKLHRGDCANNSASYVGAATNSFTSLAVTGGIGSGTGESASVSTFIPLASSTSVYKPVWAKSSIINSLARVVHGTFAGYWSGGTDAITSATLAASSGTLASGNIDLWQLALHTADDVGGSYGPVTLIDRQVADGDTEIDLTLSGTYSRWIVVQLGVVPSVDGAWVGGRVGTSGGVQSADCARHVNLSDSSSSSYNGASSASGSLTSYAATTGNVSGENVCQVIEVPNPSGQYKIISTQGAYVDNAGNAKMCNGSGTWTGGTDQLATYRILPSAGTISGLFLLYGVTDSFNSAPLVDDQGNILTDGANTLVFV